jgi:hypothetical protein
MKPAHIIAVFAIICSSAQAQITAIQSSSSLGGLGPVTTIAPLGNGYSYATVGGPHGGSWGSVQVSPGSQLSMGVTPRGGIMPIVTPTAPAPIIDPQPVPVSYPEYIPIPVPQYRQYRTQSKPPAPAATPTPYPKRKADAEKKEFNELFAKIVFKSDREKFWKDFYADWKVAPQTAIPLAYMIPYLKLWMKSNLTEVPKT